MPSHDDVEKLIKDLGGQVEERGPVLDDGSSFMLGTFPLPPDHWALQDDGQFEPPPMGLRLGTDKTVEIRFADDEPRTYTREELAGLLRLAARYAYRASTLHGKYPDLDPDALVQNFIVGVLGYWTPDGLSQDEWANP
jgi:hypothetical protein